MEAQQGKQNLKVLSVQFVPVPGAERRLAVIYDILLNPDLDRGKTNDDEGCENDREYISN